MIHPLSAGARLTVSGLQSAFPSSVRPETPRPESLHVARKPAPFPYPLPLFGKRRKNCSRGYLNGFLPHVPLKKHYAVVDLGSTGVRLVVIKGSKPVLSLEYPLRLGESLRETGSISGDYLKELEENMAKLMEDLRPFKLTSEDIVAVATASLRDASNGKEICRQIEKLGMPMHIVDGLDESMLVYPGVMQGQNVEENEKAIVVEIGGGSIELIPGLGTKYIDKKHTSIVPFGIGKLYFDDRFNPKEMIREVARFKTEMDRFVEEHPTQLAYLRKLAQNSDLYMGDTGSFQILRKLYMEDRRLYK